VRGADRIFRFGQLIAHEQHESFHASSRAWGSSLFGDLQIGTSHRDLWSSGGLLAPDSHGSAASRTNPEGQRGATGLDPDPTGPMKSPGPRSGSSGQGGEAPRRVDGLRVDQSARADRSWSTPRGSRSAARGSIRRAVVLLTRRPELSRWAIGPSGTARPGQALHGDAGAPTGAEQVDRYARLFDALVDAAGARGRAAGRTHRRSPEHAALSVRAFSERHGLGASGSRKRRAFATPRTSIAPRTPGPMIGSWRAPTIPPRSGRSRSAGFRGAGC